MRSKNDMKRKAMTKIHEVWNAYTKEKEHTKKLKQEKLVLERDKEELRERYNEKSRQKRRLEEQMGMGGGAASDGRQIAHPQPYTPSPQQHRNQQQQQHSPLFDGGVMQHQNFHTQGGGSAGGSGMHYRHHQRGNQAREQPMQIQYPVPPAQARLPTRAVHSDGHRNNATNVVDRNMGSNPWMSRSPAAMYVSLSLSLSLICLTSIWGEHRSNCYLFLLLIPLP